MNDSHITQERAEGLIIGRAINDQEITADAAGLPVDAFIQTNGRHAVLWRVILNRNRAGESFTTLDIEDEIRREGMSWPEGPQPADYAENLATQAAGVVAFRETPQAIRIVREAYHLHRAKTYGKAISEARDLQTATQFVLALAKLADGHSRAGGTLRDQWKTLDEVGKDWLITPPPEREYLLSYGDDEDHGRYATQRQGAVPKGKVCLLAAAGGVGKTHALTALALSVATGADWMGAFRVETPGRVALLLAEEEQEEVRRRLYHAAKVMGLSEGQRADALRNIIPIGLAGESVTIANDKGAETRFAGELRARLETGGPWALVVMDPLSRFGGPEMEKDNAIATQVVQVLERFTRAPGNPTVIVAHHTTKADRQGDRRGQSDTAETAGARGSSALTDGIRLAMKLMPHTPKDKDNYSGPDLITLKITKSNYGKLPPQVWLYRPDGYDGALARARREDQKKAFGGDKGGGDKPPTPTAVTPGMYDDD